MAASSPVTRIAPSPTGEMHIGTARTGLFNWLYARGRDGKFLLRIEDTDRARSTPEATETIYKGMRWLGLDWDDEPVSQFDRIERHAQVAHEMLFNGAAYKCFATQEEIQAYRDAAKAEGRSTLFRSPWRDAPEDTHPDAPYVVRLRAPQEGKTIIHDRVQGDVSIRNSELDDMILLRSDGTPTYMLAVVVDDHDMGVTHVIRGDDHLNNAARQLMIYRAMNWPIPEYAHLPLIFGNDGKKLSKRHGATSVFDYQLMGYPASGMRNYLARLGWSHGDDELFTTEQAIEWFDLSSINKAPARFDTKKLDHVCRWHIAQTENAALLHELEEFLAASGQNPLTASQKEALEQALPCVKDGVPTYIKLLEKAHFIFAERPITPDEKAQKQLGETQRVLLAELTPQLQNASWDRESLEGVVTQFAQDRQLKMGDLAGPLRAALSGKSFAPSVFDMMIVLGQEESLGRISDAAQGPHT